MDKNGVLEYLRDRLATAKTSREQMKAGDLKTFTNGRDDTAESRAELEREIEGLPELIAWIADN